VQEIYTHTRAVAGKSFPNVLTVREISYQHMCFKAFLIYI
jgi:hypothetical protein